MSKILVYSLAIVAILGLGVVGYASAGQQLLCEEFAERFNLDAEEVETFLQEKQVGIKEHKFNMLSESNGITDEQKGLMLQKKEEMSDEFEALKNLEPEERRESMQELKQEMKNWAEENSIDWGFKGKRASQKEFHTGLRAGLDSEN